MRKIFLLCTVFTCSLVASAQYKKATFLNKAGRTHELGVQFHFLQSGVGQMTGIQYSYGRDKGEQWFFWTDVELLLPTSFKYETVDAYDPTKPVTVTGKTSLGFIYRYNLGYYLTKSEKSEISRVRPFVNAGLNLYASGLRANAGELNYTPEGTFPEKLPDDATFSIGGNIGGGVVIGLSKSIGIKVNGGYNLQFNFDKSRGAEGDSFRLFGNHPYAALSVRWLMLDDN